MESKERESIGSSTTSVSVSSIVSERWRSRDSQTGWPSTYDKIVDYRATKSITIKGFLLMCGLPPNRSYYQQLCSSAGKNMHPANKCGSPGQVFLSAVANFFESNESDQLTLPVERDTDAEVCDLKLDHGDELRSLGVCGLSVDGEKKIIKVNCLASTLEDSIRDLLRQKIKMDKFVIEFCRMELLYSPPPYMLKVDVTSEHAKVGTTTPLNLTGAVVAITCAHCLTSVESEVSILCTNADTLRQGYMSHPVAIFTQ